MDSSGRTGSASKHSRWDALAAGATATVVLVFLALAVVYDPDPVAEINAEIAARGGWTELSQLLESIDVDREVQERCLSWESTHCDKISPYFENDEIDWIGQGPRAEAPPALAAELREKAACYEEFRQFFADGLVVGRRGWLTIDVTPDATFEEISEVRSRLFLHDRGYATWLQLSAYEAGDADPWLLDLDRVVAAGEERISSLGWLFQTFIRHLRDFAYLGCVVRDTVSEARVAAWIAEPPVGPVEYSRVLRGERLTWWATLTPVDAGIVACRTSLMDQRSRWARLRDDTRRRLLCMAAGARDIARGIAVVEQLERRMAGDRSVLMRDVLAERARMVTRLHGWVGGDYAHTILRWDATHRARRLTARLLLDLRAGLPLPRDEPELTRRHPTCLDGGPDQLYLRYKLLSRTQFRIVPDRDKPVGDLFPPEQLATLPSVDDPPQKFATLWKQGNGWLEVRVPDWFARTWSPQPSQPPNATSDGRPIKSRSSIGSSATTTAGAFAGGSYHGTSPHTDE